MTKQIDSIERAQRDAERIRREAERDAEDIRRNAIGSAERLLMRLQELEFPLGQLVISLRDEVEQVASEIGRRRPVDERNAGASEVQDLWDEAPRASPPLGLPDVNPSSREVRPKTLGRLGRRRARPPKDIRNALEGRCAICQRSFRFRDEDDLAGSGWKVNGDVALCPDCQADRWQLPEGARLPFRRRGS